MKVAMGSKTYIVKFKHTEFDQGWIRPRRGTDCLIFEKKGEERADVPFVSARSICDSRDHFSKFNGRKQALRNALAMAALIDQKFQDKHFRWEFWKVFLDDMVENRAKSLGIKFEKEEDGHQSEDAF